MKQQRKSQNAACSAFVEFISKGCSEGGDSLSPEQVRKIYKAAKQDIETLYTEIPKIKAAAIPIRCLD